LQRLVDQNQITILQGRAMYPRYYEAGDGESFTDATGYKIVDESRLVFELVGQADRRIVFPMAGAPDFFPNASDATVISNSNGDIWFIFVKQGQMERLYVSDLLDNPLCGE
jgi:hypothetical protein